MSDVERMILGRMTSAEEVGVVWDAGVRGQNFEEPLYGAVYEFIIDYWRKSQLTAVPSPWALAQEFPGFTVDDEAADTTEYLAEQLRKRFVTNALQEMLREAAGNSIKDPLGALKVLAAQAFETSEAVTPRITRTNMADTVQERRAEYARIEEYPQGLGVPYGIDLIDIHTGGLLPGELAAIGAVAKTGKTMFGLHTVTKMVRQGYKPIVFSLEMSLKECTKRIDAFFSGVSYNRLLHGHLTAQERTALWAAQEELAALGGIQVETPEPGDRSAVALIARARQYGADYVFIDQLSHMEATIRTYSTKELRASVLKSLKNEISRAGQELPCLLAVQMRRGDDEPSLESFADAAEVEREVDIAFGLSRTQDMRYNHVMRCDILGARRGDTASWLLSWELSNETYIRADGEIR